MNLMDMLKDQVTGSLVSQASKFLGESESGVGKALDGIFPALAGKMIGLSEDKSGLGKLFDMAKGFDSDATNDISGLFGGGAGNVAKLMNNGSGVLNLLLGNSTGGMIEKIAGFSGLKGSAASSLIKMAAPFLMSMVTKHIKNKALDAAGLSKWLGGQKSAVSSSVPSSLMAALGGGILGKGASAASGLASDGLNTGKKLAGKGVSAATDGLNSGKKMAGKVVDGGFDAGKKVVGNAADLAGNVGGAAVKTGGSIMKWLIPVAILLAVASFFGIKTCSPVDSMVDATKGATQAVVSKTADVAGDVAGAAGNAVGDVAGAAGDAVGKVGGAVGSLFGNVDAAAKAMLDKVKFTTGSAGSQMMDYINGGFKGDGKFTFKNLTFASGSAKIDAATSTEVDNMASILKTYPDLKVSVEGYTDSQGNPGKNETLSAARANAVKARLMGKGITGDRIETKGFGAASPVATNETPEGRAQNRRIELRLLK